MYSVILIETYGFAGCTVINRNIVRLITVQKVDYTSILYQVDYNQEQPSHNTPLRGCRQSADCPNGHR